jgi:hypothetical protein
VKFAASLLVLLALVGCDQSASTPTSPRPATRAAATTQSPATTTTAKAPPPTFMNINGGRVVFPAARLRLEEDDGHLVALLFSDDPREALKENYAGNSFYLKMELDVAEISELAKAQWHYTAPSASQREDSPYGIFLNGRKVQLQPFDVQARFRPNGGVTVLIAGQFQMIDSATTEPGPPKMITVAAEMHARLDKVPSKP